ncbi:YCF48-related protein [Azoarcus sp. KH32C]|uniref:YCF48-related protein n=1 Tax=Azoarcus sp. KH32C TaxID=748247 RepID=UPI00034BF8A5|nr:YCF48-related protein [Azoarcus sp. KH32C]
MIQETRFSQRRPRSGLRMLVTGLALAISVAAHGFENPQDVTAVQSAQVARSPLIAVTTAGQRLVAVGLRGMIVTSDDGGATWTQAAVPVGSDLVGVSFPTPNQGWAVGHGGVVLHSEDGGLHWTRQLEGRQAADLAVKYFKAQRAANPEADGLLGREQSLIDAGGTQPFLDVLFDSETSGFVVGAFNRIYRTGDGGKTWVPWMDRVDNPREFHLYSITNVAGQLYLTGEQGMVWKLDRARERFVGIQTPYNGTLFGMVGAGADDLLVFGMRGSLFRGSAGGTRWERIDTGSPASIVGGALLPGGRIVLANQAGGVSVSGDRGKVFSPVKASVPMPYFGITALGGDRVGLVGSEGVRVESIR